MLIYGLIVYSKLFLEKTWMLIYGSIVYSKLFLEKNRQFILYLEDGSELSFLKALEDGSKLSFIDFRVRFRTVIY